MDDRQKMIEQVKLLKEMQRRRAKDNFAEFPMYINPKYQQKWFHKTIAQYCQLFFEGVITKLIITLPPQHGKLLPADTPILTTKGWKKHGELEYGDYVFNQDGEPVMVLSNSGVYRWPVERITFQGGETILAAKEHLWKLNVEYDDHKGRREIITETQHIYDRRHRRSPYIDYPKPLQMPHRELPIDPYVLGLWLSDGLKKQGVIAIGEEDAPHYSKFGEARKVREGYYRVLVPGLRTKLRENGLIGNKHIPVEYLLSSEEQRMELLRGLMDSDGYCDTRGRCEFAQISGQLADDVYVLIRSLGYKATKTEFPMKLYWRVVGKKVRIFFSPDRNDRVFRLPRKAERLRNKTMLDRQDKYKLFIKGIEHYGEVDGNCIQVEGGMYLAGYDFIPTHNSELVSRLFPAWALGRNPDLKIVLCSYSATLSSGFNRAVQRVIGSDEYKQLFPDTFLNDERLAKYRGYVCSADMFEPVYHTGFFKTVGVGGSLTGTPADIAIIDDPVKDALEANSPVVRENIFDWYTSVLSTRLHNESRQMVIQTRWHPEDLVGMILNSPDAKNWKVINIPAICIEDDDGDLHSGRKVGEALWPEKHSLEKLNIEREKDPHVFNCLMQGDPESAEGRLYGPFKTYVDPKEWGEYVRSGCYVDVADKGTDDTTAICYDVYRSSSTIYNEQTKRMEPLLFALVKDVEINPANTDTTRITVPAMINRQSPPVGMVHIESNSGGDSFGRDISKKIRAHVNLFHQGANKESRIITNAARVNEQVVMPFDWERRFPQLYQKATHYLSVFKANAHDDVPDALTGIVEKELSFGNDMMYGKRRGVRRR